MSVASKIKWLFILAAAFLMVLATSRSKVHQSSQIQSSIESIYEDRLLVKGLIFDLARALHDKEIAHLTGDTAFFKTKCSELDAGIAADIASFEETYLTESEAIALERFKLGVEGLKALEADLSSSDDPAAIASQQPQVAAALEALHADLEELSAIQLAEGRRQMGLGGKAVGRMDLVSSVELGMLAFVLLAGMIVIFYPRA